MYVYNVCIHFLIGKADRFTAEQFNNHYLPLFVPFFCTDFCDRVFFCCISQILMWSVKASIHFHRRCLSTCTSVSSHINDASEKSRFHHKTGELQRNSGEKGGRQPKKHVQQYSGVHVAKARDLAGEPFLASVFV